MVAFKDMNWYLRLKHQQFRQFRDRNIDKVLQYILLLLLVTITFMEFQAIWNIAWTKNVIKVSNPSPVMVMAVAEASAPAGTISDDQAPKSDLSKEINNQSQEETVTVGRLSTPADIEKQIKEEFGSSGETMFAIAKAESRLRVNAQNWNCYYNGISTSCKPQDRQKAWSVDCGIFQINSISKECPNELLAVDKNIEIAKKILKTQGFNAWYTYRYAIANNEPI